MFYILFFTVLSLLNIAHIAYSGLTDKKAIERLGVRKSLAVRMLSGIFACCGFMVFVGFACLVNATFYAFIFISGAALSAMVHGVAWLAICDILDRIPLQQPAQSESKPTMYARTLERISRTDWGKPLFVKSTDSAN